MNSQITNAYAGTNPGLPNAGIDPGRRYQLETIAVKISELTVMRTVPGPDRLAVQWTIAISNAVFPNILICSA